jgi:hypothetical protein
MMELQKSSLLKPDQVRKLVDLLGGEEIVHKILSGRIKIVLEKKSQNSGSDQSNSKLLKKIGIVEIPATDVSFVAKERFKLKKDGGIFSEFNNEFRDWFLGGDGKIEEPFPGSSLVYSELMHWSSERHIISEIENGVGAKPETTLAEMFYQAEKHNKHENGVLFRKRFNSIFYVRDVDGILRVIEACWNNGELRIGAFFVNAQPGRSSGWYVYYRNQAHI